MFGNDPDIDWSLMFSIVVRFDLKDEAAAAEFDGLVAQMLPEITANEPGTLIYATHTVEGEPLGRVFYELYADRAAHAAHEAQEHMRAFFDARPRLVAATRAEFLTLGAAKGTGA
ncbi:MAG TPA: antibiotic biosynthesis monooxygenase [Mycobacteriales bacterium]|nr:antibiotic biosynthesis monooxygenase [Mycobacteriales bacterium]